MPNAFKKAASKDKVAAGGVPAELVAGKEQVQETAPEAREAVIPVAQAAMPATETVPAPAQEAPQVAAAEEESKANDLVSTYEAKKRNEPEPRTVRLQAVITPSLNEKLNALMSSGKIKSRNDLINYLLERYLDNVNLDDVK